jgi:GNAT superfamily N-acetyltransferase
MDGRPDAAGFSQGSRSRRTLLRCRGRSGGGRVASWQQDELLSLFVHPDFQGSEIGSALMSACFDDAARSNATISIVKSVLGAEEFYGRHGFLLSVRA